MRTMSLNSTSGGYGCSPLTTRPPALESKPIFYDYSEDFENIVEPIEDYPIAPTPRRVSSSLRSIIASGGCDADLESADDGDGDVIEYLRRSTMIEDRHDAEYYGDEHNRPASHLELIDGSMKPARHEPVDDALASSFVLAEGFHKMEDSSISDKALEKHHDAAQNSCSKDPDHFPEVVSDGVPSETSTLESPLEPETPAFNIQTTLPELARREERNDSSFGHYGPHDDTENNTAPVEVIEKQSDRSEPVTIIIPRPELASATSTTFHYRYSFDRKDSRLISLSSGLSDLASFIKDIDKHIQAPNPEMVDQSEISVIPGSRSEPNPDHGWNQSQPVQETPAPPRKSSLQQYRKKCVESAANTAASGDDMLQYKVISTRSGPTLVPQPISPAKMLRVKNSIPQLMKALPPLPDYDPTPDSPFGPLVVPIDIEPFELSRLTDARSTLSDAVVSPRRDKEAVKRYDPYVFDHAARKPKLKLKHAASFSPGNPRHLRSGYLEQPDAVLSEYSARRPSTATEYSTSPIKRRLPIRVCHSRPNLTPFTYEDNGTVKRRLGINKSSTISEIASSHAMDLFSASPALKVAVHGRQPIQVDSITPKLHERPSGPTRVENTADMGQQILPGDARGPSLDSRLDYWQAPSSATGRAVGSEVMQSFFSENSIALPRQGLRKTISNLRSKITESRQHQHSPLGTGPRNEEGNARGPLLAAETLSNHTFKDLLSGSNQPKGSHSHGAAAPVRKVRRKLGKLMRAAKYKLRAWGKSKHKIS